MFTGIVEEVGLVSAIGSAEAPGITITAHQVVADVASGDSIAVNGVCLTVTAHGADWFSADIMAETLDRTDLGRLKVGAGVNLERAMPSNGRFGGHIVQGHTDGVATITAITPSERWTVLRLAPAPSLARYIAEKGSVALNGVSLTVSAVSQVEAADSHHPPTGAGHHDEPFFEVSLIPTTLAETTLGGVQVGDEVNLEVDVIAKYLERLGHHTTTEVGR